MMNFFMKSKIIVDSNLFIAAYNTHDSLHLKAVESFQNLRFKQKLINPFIYSEICTVLLLRTKSLFLVKQFDQDIRNASSQTRIHHFSPRFLSLTQKIFFSQPHPKLSFADCSLIAQARSMNIDDIATLDQEVAKFFRSSQ